MKNFENKIALLESQIIVKELELKALREMLQAYLSSQHKYEAGMEDCGK
jgi:hypothetical protein